MTPDLPHDQRRPLPTPYYQDDAITLYTGDAVDVLSCMPDASVDCVVMSPPYWGLRTYGIGRWEGGDPACTHSSGVGTNTPQSKTRVTCPVSIAHPGGDDPRRCSRCGAQRMDRQYGLEATPDEYAEQLRGLFTHLRRVLVDTGTVWLNLGDCYSADPPGRTPSPMRRSTLAGASAAEPMRESVRLATVRAHRVRSMPRKNLIGIPWRVAFTLQEDDWILRNAIVWYKPNAVPESVRDRVSNRYEMLFLLTKQQRYFFDLDPIRAPLAQPEAVDGGMTMGGSDTAGQGGVDAPRSRRGESVHGKNAPDRSAPGWRGDGLAATGSAHRSHHPRGKNPGDVWSISTRPLREAHFAAFPVDLPLRCIAAGCPNGGVVLDPFSGAATTGLAARQLGRSYIGIDLYPDYHAIGLRRLGLDSDTNEQDAA